MNPPQIHNTSFIDKSAVILGEVIIEENCAVFPGAVIRGDQNTIHIGSGSNVQDNCVIHTDTEHKVSLGKNVSIGHCAMVHGATIEDNVLIGIHATLLNGCHIGHGSIIGAGALVTENKVIPPHSLVVGVPGKIVKTDPALEQATQKNASIYHKLAPRHKKSEFVYYKAEQD